MAKKKSKNNKSTANLGFEEKLWAAAEKLRSHMDPSEYKHTVLGLIFLKYISDRFKAHREKLKQEMANPKSLLYIKEEQSRYASLEDRDEYTAENVFWVPLEARWRSLQDKAEDPSIGKFIDDAMLAIERENPRLKGVLPKTYARSDLNKRLLGELLDLIGTIGLGDEQVATTAGIGIWTGSLAPQEPELPLPTVPISSLNDQTDSNCSPCYPGVCIPPRPPDLDCGEISYRRFSVVGCDPHNFDGDDDGIGCEN